MASMKGAGPAFANDDSDIHELEGSDIQELIARPLPGGTHNVNFEIDSGGPGTRSIDFLSDTARLCCHQFPCLCRSLATVLSLALLSLLSYALAPSRGTGAMGGDYSAINSAYELNLSRVDHWCIRGDDDSCTCEDPLEASSRSEFKSWNAAHRTNVADVELYRSAHGEGLTTAGGAGGGPRPPIDVAFVGESVVEAMDGRWLGKRIAASEGAGGGEREGPEATKGPDIGKVFEKLFRKESGGPVEGLALGIAGDNTANVLWRLQHGEMPADFNPKVWWIVLGMNDIARTQCSEEIVVLGILRVAEEIRLRKPDAHIVINSLLPMVDFQLMEGRPHMEDFADFRREKDGVRESMEIQRAREKFHAKFPEERTRHLRRKKRRHRHRHRHDDDEAEGEELQEALERRKKTLDARDKRTHGKVFWDDERYRPNGPLPLFLPGTRHHALPPVWPAVHLVNDKLKEFCKKHDSISFFDATPIFTTDEGSGGHRFRSELISPRGHPSEIGFLEWEAQVLKRLWGLLPPPDPPTSGDGEEDGLEPMRGGTGAGTDGNGAEHVSEGKESEPPRVERQPSRDRSDRGEERDGDDDNDNAAWGGDYDVDIDDEPENGGRGVRRRMGMKFMR